MKELSVVIVDDDQLILNNILNMVNWSNLGFHVVATATSGKKALVQIKSHNPSLLITDIIMPGMNGLELISEAKKVCPNLQVIIISSYEEFEYAKKAIESKVANYVLKSEVTTASFSSQLSIIHQILTSNNQVLASALNLEISEILDKDEEFEEIIRNRSFPQIAKVINNFYHFFIISQRTGFTRYVHDALYHFTDSADQVYKALSSMDDFESAPIILQHKQYCIVGITLEGSKKNNEYALNSLKRKMIMYLNKSTTHNCILFSSKSTLTLKQLYEFYVKNQPMLSFYSLFQPVSSITFPELCSIPHSINSQSFNFKSLSQDTEHIENDILKLKDYLTTCYQNKNYPSLVNFFQEFCSHINISSISSSNDDIVHFFPSFEYLLKFVFNSYEKSINYSQNIQLREYSPAVETAVKYMQKNYCDYSLTAEDISYKASLSPSRLGVLFKQETGKTINEFLIDTRIHNAIYLLSNTTMKIYEISDQCGYKSSQYFSQMFYRKTGKRPIEYRKRK